MKMVKIKYGDFPLLQEFCSFMILELSLALYTPVLKNRHANLHIKGIICTVLSFH